MRGQLGCQLGYDQGIDVYEQLIAKLAGRVATDVSHPAKRQRVN